MPYTFSLITPQNGSDYTIKHEKWGSNLKVAPKLCIFLYNAMESTGVRQGMGMHSDVMDTVFNAEVSAVLRSE